MLLFLDNVATYSNMCIYIVPDVTIFRKCVSIYSNMFLFIAGEKYESVDDLTLPIPMERLREMANRMNQILTNLLVSSVALT